VNKKILLLRSRRFDRIFPSDVLAKLEALAELSILDPDGSKLSERQERLAAALRESGASVLVTGWGMPMVTLAMTRESPRLKFIHHTAGTVRSIVERDVFVRENAPVVANWGNTVAPSVAEAALMMTLAGLRRVAHCQMTMHVRRKWGNELDPVSLFERSVGIHGFGAIAREYAKLLKPFRCSLSSFCPGIRDEVLEAHGVRRVDSLRALYGSNDVISCHEGSTPETYHVVNREVLGRMRDGALLVNTARGEIIDTDALIAELRTGRIHAALDVYEPEPPPADSPLRGLENCLLIPHDGGPTSDWLPRMGLNCVRNVEKFFHGEEPEHVVTLEAYDRAT
jgi:phosphoglycerate dehydrogenase-like enzyme